MKRFVLILCTMFFCVAAIAQTINIDWKVGNNIYSQSTCEYGGDLNVPTAPTKYGYTFQGWVSYTPIEYLESTGTQAIDTEHVFSGLNNKVIIKFALLEVPSSTDACLTGAEDSGGNWAFISRLGRGSSTLSVYQAPSVGGTGLTAVAANKIYTLQMLQQGNLYSVNLNGRVYEMSNNKDSYTTTSFSLFADKYKSGAYTQKTKARIYYCQIYENDTLVRDFIPVLDANGIPCMYDKVTKQFFYNQGTGNFIAGPIINE